MRVREQRGWKAAVGLPALVLYFLAAGCGGPLTFRYHLAASPQTLDPTATGYSYSLAIIDRLFDGLMRLDRESNLPVYDLAIAHTVSLDGLVYEFRLADEARFHHGRRVEAADVKDSWTRLLASAKASQATLLFDLIEGADAFREGRATSVAGIETVGSDIVRVRLREPFGPFLYVLAHPSMSIVPREEVERPRFGRQPVGSGPFRFHAWPSEDRVELAAFPEHHRRPPQVDKLVYRIVPDAQEALRLYRQGELDLVTQLPSDSVATLRQTLSPDLRIFPGSAWYGFCFEGRQPPFDDPRVRRALSLVIDREALVETLGELQYMACSSFLPQIVPGQDPGRLGTGYDPDEARRLLAEAGFPEGRGFPSQVYGTRDEERDRRVGRFLTAAFAELGLDIQLRLLSSDALQKAIVQERSLPIHRLGWGGQYPDPEPFLRPLFYSKPEGWYRNEQVDKALDRARTASDFATRLDLYLQAEEQIVQDAPCVALYHANGAILLRPEWRGIPVGHNSLALEIELARWDEDG